LNLLLADTFKDALGKLASEEQKAVKITVLDLQLNPEHPGNQFHRVDRAKDKDFWSVRVNRDIRLILHKRGSNLLVCYVDHHDDAYAWAQHRRLETHPKTGGAQIVQIRETVRDIEVPNYFTAESLEGEISVEPEWLSEQVSVLAEDRVEVDPGISFDFLSTE